MKSCSYKIFSLALLLVLPLTTEAAPPKPTAKATNSFAAELNLRSSFVQPKTPKDGRDPFFPKAVSLYGSTAAAGPAVKVAPVLKLKGVGDGFAVINGSTLAIGETQEIKTPGGPVNVHLVEVKLQDEVVVIEVNGNRQELGMTRSGLTPR